MKSFSLEMTVVISVQAAGKVAHVWKLKAKDKFIAIYCNQTNIIYNQFTVLLFSLNKYIARETQF